ncbi:hypothetical protein KS4_23150 [Poriferisphaera corsica]|uniref:Alpha/beta hydrolase n=1 Tax=Poriferisphaera corsica TaxID=2528020 RepID=A0A517YVK4_9BACT|nr:hypothetical protein [Poriferisphaera corsica]QDU34249.1 hypothetical protein KS4_23150 [Poriferisphaera corsica]
MTYPQLQTAKNPNEVITAISNGSNASVVKEDGLKPNEAVLHVSTTERYRVNADPEIMVVNESDEGMARMGVTKALEAVKMAGERGKVKRVAKPASPAKASKKTRIIKLHGFNVHDKGAATVDMLNPYLADYDYQDLDYGYFNLKDVRMKNSTVALALAVQTKQPKQDIWLGHSNGCAIIYEALELMSDVSAVSPEIAEYLPYPQGIILINPALDADIEFPEGNYFIHIYYSPSDDPVWWAKWLWWHKWGSMGRDGYTGKPDPRINQFNEMDLLARNIEHSDVFKPGIVKRFAPFLIHNIKTELEASKP